MSLLFSTQAVLSAPDNIVDYKAKGTERFVWDISTKLKCDSEYIKCNNQTAYIILRDYEFEYREQLNDSVTPSKNFWWDIFEQYKHDDWELRAYEPQRTIEHSPTLFFRIHNAHSKNPSWRSQIIASPLELRTCHWDDRKYHKLCDEQLFDYDHFAEYIQKDKPIPIVTPFGYTLYLNTQGIYDVIEASKIKAEAKLKAENLAYEDKFKAALIKGIASNIAIFALILFGIFIMYKTIRKVYPILKMQVSYYLGIINGKISKSSNGRYKIGIAQEMEALKRLEQQGEISKEDYERAKQKLKARM